MSERLIVGITGYAGSGKSAVGRYFKDAHGFYVVDGGDLIREEAASRGVRLVGRSDYEEFFKLTQPALGYSWISDRLLASDHDRLMQVGLRSPFDAANIRRFGGTVGALICERETRLERMDGKDPKNSLTLKELRQYEELERSSSDELGSHTQQVIEAADWVLRTDDMPIATMCQAASRLILEGTTGQQM